MQVMAEGVGGCEDAIELKTHSAMLFVLPTRPVGR